MKCDQYLCLSFWYDFKKLVWQDELNPRVRCAFGNVFLKPEEQIYDCQVGSVPGKRIDCCCGEAECRGRLLWDVWTWKIVRQTEISPYIMIRKKTIRLLEFDLHSKRYFLWNISVRPWTGLETCQTWCNICLVPRRMFEALFVYEVYELLSSLVTWYQLVWYIEKWIFNNFIFTLQSWMFLLKKYKISRMLCLLVIWFSLQWIGREFWFWVTGTAA